MFKTSNEIAKDIRTELKEMGLNSRKISVRKNGCNVVTVDIKDESIEREKIKQLANRHTAVEYCEKTGEVLAGGNIYVFVE